VEEGVRVLRAAAETDDRASEVGRDHNFPK
jgi:hypothetical protein